MSTFRRRIIRILTTVCFALQAISNAQAAVTNLVAVADSALLEPSPANNLGRLEFLTVGVTGQGLRTRGLVRFDVAGVIPPGATITSALLTLAVNPDYAKGAGHSFATHRMQVGWTEGSGNGAPAGAGTVGSPATVGEVTWNSRAHGIASWGAAGAKAGEDYVSSASATNVMTVDALTFSSATTVFDVQLWLDSPTTNSGWIIIASNEVTAPSASRIGSRESTSQPVLTVQYNLPAPAPPDIFTLASVGNQVRFSFNGQAGKSYTVQSRLTLGTDWSTLTFIPALAANSVVHITNAIAVGEKYYRVRTP